MSNNYILLNFRFISPLKIFLLGILFIFILILIAPLKYLYLGSLYSWLYIFLSIISVIIGIVLSTKSISIKSRDISFFISKRIIKKLFLLAGLLSFGGILLRIYDKFFIRGLDLAANMMENREILTDAGTNVFAIISALFYPVILLLPFLYLMLRKSKQHKVMHLFVTLLLSMFIIVDGIFLGSRSVLFVFIILIVFYLYSMKYINLNLKLKNIIILFLFLTIFFIFNGYIFDLRTSLMFLDPILSTQNSVYAFFIPLNNEAVNYLYSIHGDFQYYLILGLVNFIQYMVHGIFELLYLVDNFNTEYISYGSQNFSIFVKFVYKVLGISFSFDENQAYLVRTGIYNTFFGPVYYDFSFYGILFTFLFSYTVGKIYILIRRGDIFLFPLYIYFISILLFSFVVNMIVFAQGIYNIVAFIIFYLIAKMFYRKKLKGKRY